MTVIIFYCILFQASEDVTPIGVSSENDHDGMFETDNESVDSIKSDSNDLTLQTLNSQEVFNFVSLPSVMSNRTLYHKYTFRKNLWAILSTPVWKQVSHLELSNQYTVRSTSFYFIDGRT